MGLAIEVGALAYLMVHDEEGAEWVHATLITVNAYLRRAGLPDHHEPEELPKLHWRTGARSFPYSFLHYLRRVYAHARRDPDWEAIPAPKGWSPARDEALDRELTVKMDSHLICHSDAEGFYVPVDFQDIVYGDLPGGMLGSSYRLREELQVAARPLGITLENGALSDQEAARINALGLANVHLYREYTVWLALFEAARLSIEHGTAIRFG